MGYETITIHQTDPSLGVQIVRKELRVHSRDKCANRTLPCVIHRPSEHHMRDWPLNWRADTRVMERVCPHGVGHPDPDHMTFMDATYPDVTSYQGIHGCDGCCREVGKDSV
jgi:hypothetical protein